MSTSFENEIKAADRMNQGFYEMLEGYLNLWNIPSEDNEHLTEDIKARVFELLDEEFNEQKKNKEVEVMVESLNK